MYRPPTTAPTRYKRYGLLLPDNEEWTAVFLGCLLHLSSEYHWSEDGIGAESASAIWSNLLSSDWSLLRGTMEIGELIWLACESTADYLCPADGRQLAIADYGALYAAIGDIFGGADSGFFRVPNLTGRFIRGGGISDLGNTGGVETVSLAVDNLPAHHHSIHSHLEGVALTPGELPVTLPNIAPANSGDTGSGQSFDILPPFIRLLPYICVR